MSRLIKAALIGRSQFNVEKFRSQLSALGGPAGAANFYVRIFSPKSLLSVDNASRLLYATDKVAKAFGKRLPLSTDYQERAKTEIPRDFEFLASQASIPGKTIATQDITQNYGPLRKIPYDVLYEDFSVTMYVRSAMMERMFFEHWMQSIYAHYDIGAGGQDGAFSDLLNSASGSVLNALGLASGDRQTAKALKENTISWYEDIISNLEVFYFDPDGEERFKVSFKEAFPTSVAAIPLDWATKDDIVQMTVTFAYKYYEMEVVPPTELKRIAYFTKSLADGRTSLSDIGSNLTAGLTSALR